MHSMVFPHIHPRKLRLFNDIKHKEAVIVRNKTKHAVLVLIVKHSALFPNCNKN